MFFSDGSKAEASAIAACDGAHSAVRKIMLGSDHPAATPKFSGTAGYRAVLPRYLHEQAAGSHIAHSGHMMCGPSSCAIMYPINQGKDVNIGLWMRKTDPMWNEPDHPWVLHQQKQQMLEDFKDWGPTMQRLMSFMSEETQLWGAYHYSAFPEHYYDRRVCLIGDAAHAMSPHQGKQVSSTDFSLCPGLCARYYCGIHRSMISDMFLLSSMLTPMFILHRSRRLPSNGRCFRTSGRSSAHRRMRSLCTARRSTPSCFSRFRSRSEGSIRGRVEDQPRYVRVLVRFSQAGVDAERY